QIVVVLVGGPGTMNHPDVIVGIHRHTRDLAEHPVVREVLRPIRVRLVLRQRWGRRGNAGDDESSHGQSGSYLRSHRLSPGATAPPNHSLSVSGSRQLGRTPARM